VIALTIVNPTTTPIKTFMFRYDLHDMPAQSKTFVRQKIQSATAPHILYYAMQVQAISPKKKRYYLCKHIRIVFPYRLPDQSTKLATIYEIPDNPKYYDL
jgi:hypothetical protein